MRCMSECLYVRVCNCELCVCVCARACVCMYSVWGGGGRGGACEEGILKGGITVPLTSCLTGLDKSVFSNKNKNCQLSYS